MEGWGGKSACLLVPPCPVSRAQPRGGEPWRLCAWVPSAGKWGRKWVSSAAKRDATRQHQDVSAGGPCHCLLGTQHLRAPTSWTPRLGPASPAEAELTSAPPLCPRAPAGAPPARLRRVTRGAQLRRAGGRAQAVETAGKRAAWRRQPPRRARRGPSPCRATRS